MAKMFLTNLITLLPLLASLTTFVFAVPLAAEPLHKLEARKLPLVRDGEHPHMAFTRHQNAVIKRAHQIKRTTPPPDSLFRERTMRRREMLEDPGQLDKRSWLLRADSASTTNTASAPAPTVTISEEGNNEIGFALADWEAYRDDTLTPSSSSDTIGGLRLDIDSDDLSYIAEISIGTPSQTFKMLIDISYGDTWVPSTACNLTTCGNHTKLGPDVSSSFAVTKMPWSDSYQPNNTITGTLCLDTVTIAGFELVNHPFGVATQVDIFPSEWRLRKLTPVTKTPGFLSGPADGVMGLGFSASSNQHQVNPIDSLVSAGLVKAPIVGYALGRLLDGNHNGEITFGKADASKLDSTTTQTLPVLESATSWEVEMGAVTVNGKEVVSGGNVTLSTGSTLIVGPKADVASLHAQINGSAPDQSGTGFYTIPCATDAVVTMQFGNAAFQIDARDLIWLNATASLTGDCISSFIGEDIDGSWILGDAFFKNVYMTTDAQKRTVQFSGRTDLPLASTFSPPGR